jgi:uncharacterized lipoprotein YmbA
MIETAIVTATGARRRWLSYPLLLVVAAVLLSGCGTVTGPAAFYRLTALPPAARTGDAANAPSTPRLLIGPVEVPDYLDRPQLVTRSGIHELSVDEFNRWGGSLREELLLALTLNLASLLGPGMVAGNGAGAAFEDALQLRVDLLRLEGSDNGEVELLARWTLLEDGGRRAILSRRTRVTAPVSGAGPTSLVAAYSEAVALFSKELAGPLGDALR